MEAALPHLSCSSYDSELISCPNYADEPDVLMADPLLDYLNQVLMEEGEEDVRCMQQDAEESYRTIVSSLYDIIGENSPLDSSSSNDSSAFDLSRRLVSSHDATTVHENGSGFHSSCSRDKSSYPGQHAYKTESHIGHSSLNSDFHDAGVISNLRPAYGNVDVSLEQGKANSIFSGDLKYRSYDGGKVKDQEQGTSLLPLDDMKSISLAVSFEELKVRPDYGASNLGKPSILDISTSTHKGAVSQSVRNGGAEVVEPVDLRELLITCAKAVAIGDVKWASEILRQLYQVHGASSKGNVLQRTAHYFCNALVARMEGMGGHQFRIMRRNMPSTAAMLNAFRLWFEVTPQWRVMHYFANQNILKAAEGASTLHILDYGMLYGIQWPGLINSLADREGGPPLLVITGIDFPMPEQNSMQRLEESGRWLAAYARTYNVPFRFHAVVSENWGDIDPAALHLQKHEVLVISCTRCLRHLPDDSSEDASRISPRQKILNSLRTLNPRLLLAADANVACNSPFFVSRFREALYYYSTILDMYDTLGGDRRGWRFVERNMYSRDILNIVACEGAERVERPETYKQWDVRFKKAGFELLPMSSDVLSRSRCHVQQQYPKDFTVHDDAKGWMLLCWKGRIMVAVSAWKPGFRSSALVFRG